MNPRQPMRTDTSEPHDHDTQSDDDRSAASAAGAVEGALGNSHGSAERSDAPPSQSTTGTPREDSGGTAQTGMAGERERERSSQGLDGAQGSGDADRGSAQDPDRRDPSPGSATERGVI